MRLLRSLKIALNIILHSKLRSWLTVIGIVIGVAAVIAIVSIGEGFQTDIQGKLGAFGSDKIYVTAGFEKANNNQHGPPARGGLPVKTTTPLTNKELQVIKGITDVGFVDTVISGDENVYYLGESASLMIVGSDQNVWKYVTTSKLESGRFLGPGDSNVVVLGNTVAHELFSRSVGINRMITIGDKSFTVVGILKKDGSGFGMDDRRVYMPINSAKVLFNRSANEYDSFTVQVKNPENINTVENIINQKLFTLRHVTEDTKDFTVVSMKTIQETVSSILLGFTLFLGSIAAISLLVGSVGIANTMFTSVLEKTKDIGIMKALGARNKDILTIFLFTSGFIGLVGGIIGALFGICIALLIPKLGVGFSSNEPITTSISFTFILIILIFSVVLGMISGVIPAYRASKLNPVDALRYE